MISRELNCDYMELSYPFNISEMGFCIVSNIKISNENEDKNEKNQTENLKFSQDENFMCDLKIMDLNELKYETKNEILKENCECFTCTKGYSKAYIHHLIKCNEINGKILLIM
jgi:hypothetical protein